ncbi:OLC1v1013617C1 [Oldenlandia corymbosa var. corymbosa]|nr:OLC1v1013617C1 [Oldenlandia corymbosa var. corymbosa]
MIGSRGTAQFIGGSSNIRDSKFINPADDHLHDDDLVDAYYKAGRETTASGLTFQPSVKAVKYPLDISVTTVSQAPDPLPPNVPLFQLYDRYPKIENGTTSLAFVIKDGIIIAVDHGPSTGSRPESLPENVIELDPRTLCTISGDIAGCKSLSSDLLKECCGLAKNKRFGSRIISQFIAENLFSRVEGALSGMIIAGFDEMGALLYCVDGLGYLRQGRKFTTGSGSGFTLGALYARYSYRLSSEEAAEAAKDVLCLAAFRARESHGFVSVFHVGPNGWKKLIYEDIGKVMEKQQSLWKKRAAEHENKELMQKPYEISSPGEYKQQIAFPNSGAIVV